MWIQRSDFCTHGSVIVLFPLCENHVLFPQGVTKSQPCQEKIVVKLSLLLLCWSHLHLPRIPPKPVTCRPMNASRLQWHKSITYWKVSAAHWKYADTYMLVATRYQIKANKSRICFISQVFPAVCNNSLNLSFSLQTCGGWQLNRLREASYVMHRNKNRWHTEHSCQRQDPNPCLKVFSCCKIFDMSQLGFHIIPLKCVTGTSAKWTKQ